MHRQGANRRAGRRVGVGASFRKGRMGCGKVEMVVKHARYVKEGDRKRKTNTVIFFSSVHLYTLCFISFFLQTVILEKVISILSGPFQIDPDRH